MLVVLIIMLVGVVMAANIALGPSDKTKFMSEEAKKNKNPEKIKQKLLEEGINDNDFLEFVSNLSPEPSSFFLDSLIKTFELGKKERWGNIITAFSNYNNIETKYENYGEEVVHVFEEGIYFSKKQGEVNQFASKKKIQILELDNRKELLILIVVNHNVIFKINRYSIEDSMNDLLNWYGNLDKNRTLIKKYNNFTEHIGKMNEEYLLYAYPYTNLIDLSYGEFLIKEYPSLILGKNITDKSLLLEFRYKVTEEPIRIKIPYDSIVSFDEKGEIENITSTVSEGYFTGEKWDRKKVATGYIIAGPVGSALMGKEKSKYVPPVYSTIDLNRRKIHLNIKNPNEVTYEIGSFKRTLKFEGLLEEDSKNEAMKEKLINEGVIKGSYEYSNKHEISSITNKPRNNAVKYFNQEYLPIKATANIEIDTYENKIIFPFNIIYGFVEDHYLEKLHSKEHSSYTKL